MLKSVTAWPPRNKLLNLLPADDLARLRPLLEPVTLKRRRTLFHPKSPLDAVYFVEDGLVSVLTQLDDSRAVEVWLTGREGVLGLPVILGSTKSPHRRVAQLGGSALRMRADDARAVMHEIPSVSRLLLRYVHAVLIQASQAGACNSAHRLELRLARWLLAAADRCEPGALPLTHDILARMLGVRRASVSENIRALEQEGLVRTSRGRIQIRNRPGLEARSCHCYRIMNSEYERMELDLRAAFTDRSVAASRSSGHPGPKVPQVWR